MKAADIKNDLVYEVRLNAPVYRGRHKHLPRDQHRFRGDVLQSIIDGYGLEVFDVIEPATSD